MEEDREFTFQSTNLPQRSFELFSDMRDQCKFCDIQFTVGNKRIIAHRLILAAAIPVFQKISLSEEEIPVPDVDPSVFECLIDYAYSCKLKITEENVRDLLLGASFLGMKDIQDACCDYLAQSLHPENALEFMEFADKLDLPQLKKYVDLYVTEKFLEVSRTETFLNFPFRYIKELFAKDDLNVQGEENVLEAALRWIKASESERKDRLPELLGQVRMVLLDPLYITDMVEREKLIRTSLASRDLVDEAKNYNLFPKRRKIESSFSDKPREFMKISEATQETGKTIYSLKAEIKYTLRRIDTTNGMWSAKESQSFWVRSGSAAVLNRKMYFFHSGYVFEYDPEGNKSEMFEQLTVPRYMAAAVSLRNKIFICGGYTSSGAASNAVECFDPEKNEWTQINPLHTGRRGLNAVSLEEYIYVLGGEGTGEIYGTVERYSFVTGKWHYMASMLTPRSSAGAAVLNGKIYICGGCINLDRKEFTATAEIYDPIANYWKSISPMNSVRSVKTLNAFCGKLYAIGGNDSHGKVRHSCEVYDQMYDKWTYGISTPSSHPISAAVIMHVSQEES